MEIFKYGTSDDERAQRMLVLDGEIATRLCRMPRQLSGGQKQRIVRAFAVGAHCGCGRTCSALDVSVQAAVTDLLMEIQRTEKTTLLFISHDLSIVRYLSTA